MTASLWKLTAGDGYTYLTRQVAASDSTELGSQTLADYYSAKGEAPGRWQGKGLSGVAFVQAGDRVTEAQMKALFGEGRQPEADRIEQAVVAAQTASGATEKQAAERALKASALGARFGAYATEPSEFVIEVSRRFRAFNREAGAPDAAPIDMANRARIRGEIAREFFAKEYGRDPLDARELAAHVAKLSRPPRRPVAGYDITFSPVKSVSALWAVADPEVAQMIEQAHSDAVQDTMDWVERKVSYTRRGHGGVRQVDIHGLVTAQFVHRDSRAGDPDLHTHVAVSNKVQAVEDGAWLALDGQPIHEALVSASERYNTRLEVLLRERLGLDFAAKESGSAEKRPIREVVGMDASLLTAWSSRRSRINERRTELAAEFTTVHGRPPTPKEAIALAQQANLDTREAKHEPRSLDEQRAVWAEQAQATLGGHEGVEAMLRGVFSGAALDAQPVRVPDLAARVVHTLESRRAHWKVAHVRAEAERMVREVTVPADQVDAVVDEVIEQALGATHSVPLTKPDGIDVPRAAQRRDGSSVWERAGQQLFTSERVLAAEASLVAAAKRTDGRTLSVEQVSIGLLEAEANGLQLNPAQTQMVTEMATSGSRCQLGLAPAGSGKTTAMKVLVQAWESGGGTVVGLAPSAVAAAELGSAINAQTDTLAKLTHHLDNGGGPEWIGAINERTIVIIDEAGMASTPELARAVDYVVSRGGSVRLIGDDQQLAAIGAGGVLRDIADEVGAVTLSELHRFTDVAEAEATLALRDGAEHALGFYLDQGRVHVTADGDTVVHDVFEAWQADIDAGKESLMLAATNERVQALNDMARLHRLSVAGEDPGPEVQLASGSRASAGDRIATRKNDRTLMITPSHWVKNRDRWDVLDVAADGSLKARHLATGRTLTLPAEYVSQHVDLAYATTYHGAQGQTVDTTHCALSGSESRQLLYVGMSRGRAENHVYVPVSGDGDEHNSLRPETLSPATAVDVLHQVLARDDTPRSARTETREAEAPATRLAQATRMYLDAVDLAATTQVGPERIAELTGAAEQIVPAVTQAPAWEVLRAHLCRLDLAGADPVAALKAASQRRGLADARDPAAVLDWRLDRTGAHSMGARPGRLPWLPNVPDGLDDEWTRLLASVGDRIDNSATQYATQLQEQPAEALPRWAEGLAGDRDLLVDLALWRVSVGVPEDDRSPAGPPHPVTALRAHQRTLERRVAAHRGGEQAATRRWESAVQARSSRVTTDPYWPVLAERLNLAAAAGYDVARLLDEVTSRPLPDEHAAAALWSRLSAHLGAASAATARTGSGATRLRPAWSAALAASLSEDLAGAVMADPAWPALVAAVHKSSEQTSTDPVDLIASAVSLIDIPSIGTPGGVPRDGLATVLTWRIHDVTSADTQPDPDPDEHHVPDDVDALLAQWAAEAHDGASDYIPDDLPPEPEPEHPEPTPEPDQPQTGRERIVELHGLAATFYADTLASTPEVDAYLRERTGGADLTGVVTGYAPAQWDALTRHLQATGATADELVDAGLARYSRRGTLIDIFRDRVVLGLHDGEDLVGFTGRAAPTAPPEVPKWINTPETAAFTKGRILFGAHEHADLLADGARVCRVEGPWDALAVTAASHGTVVGLAPMGTALTAAQLDQLLAHADGQPILHAPDQDRAGRAAAEKDYWAATERGARMSALVSPGEDPADAWVNHRDAFTALLATPEDLPPLATIVLDTRLATFSDSLSHGWVETRVAAARAAAHIIASAPVEQWTGLAAQTEHALGPGSGELVWSTTFLAALDWDPMTPSEDLSVEVVEQKVADTRQRLKDLATQLGLDTDSPSASEPAAALAELRHALNEQDEELAARRAAIKERLRPKKTPRRDPQAPSRPPQDPGSPRLR